MVAKTEEASFPSNFERTIASALLLLSSSAPEGSSNNSCSPESLESSGFSASKSSGGFSIEEASVDKESSRAQQLTVVAYVSDVHELKLKIVRKKRSKSIFISNGKKLKTSKPEPTSAPASSESVSEVTTTEASSCISSSSSAQSFFGETNAAGKLTKPFIPGHMGQRAAAILRILSNGSASEVKLRQLLGDSPSTSKALRMLLKRQEVKRFGAGGRADPYTYTVIIREQKFNSLQMENENKL
ncbi:hypothetical protein CDL12_17127 [Handroanthus impetiginosus]|uniref:HTH three-helical bundle domain-containing protein n=1 Tax=Handroanthus impetiginosus TaxID=429701 RepID=A0A2G9GZ45_9LAMI|nr:hypothetical protein CDL12_17127 [Handroanthus impetiginosus]